MPVYRLQCLDGEPFVFAGKVEQIEDTSLEHRLTGKHKNRNIYFTLNQAGETYFEIFKQDYRN